MSFQPYHGQLQFHALKEEFEEVVGIGSEQGGTVVVFLEKDIPEGRRQQIVSRIRDFGSNVDVSFLVTGRW